MWEAYTKKQDPTKGMNPCDCKPNALSLSYPAKLISVRMVPIKTWENQDGQNPYYGLDGNPLGFSRVVFMLHVCKPGNPRGPRSDHKT